MARAMRRSESRVGEDIERMRGSYLGKRARRARSSLLGEFVEITGWEREPSDKVLLGKRYLPRLLRFSFRCPLQ